MIHPIDSMRRWLHREARSAPALREAPGNGHGNGNGNGNGVHKEVKIAPEAPWLAQLDGAGIPRTLTYPTCTLGRLVDHAADRYGDATAIVYGNSRWNYRELLAQVNRMAGGLAGLGVRRGDRVLLTLPNCPEMVVGFLAVQKLGAVVVNAGPLMGVDDLTKVISMATPRVAIGLDLQAPLWRSMACSTVEHWVSVSLQAYQPVLKQLAYRYKLWQDGNGHKSTAQHVALGSLLENAPSRPPSVEPDPAKTAVLQPTGGTTGTLKLAQLSHRGLLANAMQVSRWMSCQEAQERFLAVLPMFHVYGLTTCLMVPLFSASSMILMTRFAAPELIELVQRERATIVPLVPAICAAVCDEFDKQEKREKRAPAPLNSVRICLSGAAPLPAALAERFTKTTGVAAIEGYGLTEASPVTHANLFGKPRAGIGLPMPDTRVRVVEVDCDGTGNGHAAATLRDVAPGEPGEMLVSGPQVMLGYYANPEQTRAALVTDEQGTVWLRTGDIVRVDEEGYFHVLDRKKDMIIRSGLKVYPARVEQLLRRHPRVVDVAVVGRADPTHTEIVVAVIVTQPQPRHRENGAAAEEAAQEQERLTDELRAFCREHLAPYEVPKKFEFVDKLPRSPLGKLLKRELRGDAGGNGNGNGHAHHDKQEAR
jgi:long-chain acyl-CoA synthetase